MAAENSDSNSENSKNPTDDDRPNTGHISEALYKCTALTITVDM